METIILNTILVTFPILMYLVFSCYNVLNSVKVEKKVFIITICTSLYLSLNYSGCNDMELLLLFCNIPILICYFKKEKMLGFILSNLVIIFTYYNYSINIYIVIIKYYVYFFTYILLYKRKDFKYLFFKIVAIIQGFFITFEYFMNMYNDIDRIFILIGYTLIIYFITFFCLYLFKLSDNITKLYIDMNKIKEENKLKNSLFKLTHEIKNPIAVCKGYIDMINLDNIDKSKKYIGIIKSELDRSLNVMNDFMDYSKIKINKDIFDMNILLDEIYDSFNLLLRGKNIKFNYNNNFEEIYLNGDYDRLKQVFINIIKNSIESIDRDGIIDIDVSLINNMIKIIVSDNGIGMNKESLDNIYDMFYTTKKNGTGLGVSLSNEIISGHGGKMIYESTECIGTKCIITLPL